MIASTTVPLRVAGFVHWLSRAEPIVAGPSLGEVALFRGFADDFLGDAVDDRYELRTVGAASSLTLQDAAHGGILRLLTGANVGDWARIMLGDVGYNTDNLDPDDGFEMIGRFKLSHTTSIYADFFAYAGMAGADHVHIAVDTSRNQDWWLRTDNSSMVENWVDSGVAFDTSWHWHRLYARSGYIAHYLDGTLINSTTTKIPVVPMTANVRVYAQAAASRWLDLDYWKIVPR